VNVVASNGLATFNVITDYLISALIMGLAFTMILEGEYARAGLSVLFSLVYGLLSALTGRYYLQKLHDGRQKLLEILQPKPRQVGDPLRDKL
jgi:hypothetical protein